MLKEKTVAVIIPAYNEESQILNVIESIPQFVDFIIVVNDCSTDNTFNVLKNKIGDPRGAISFQKDLIDANKISQMKFKAEKYLIQKRIDELKLFVKSEIINNDCKYGKIILINHLKNSGPGAARATGYKWCLEHEIYCSAVMDGDGQMDPGELESLCLPIVTNEVDYVKGNRLIHRSAWFIIPKVRFFGNSILSILNKIASGYWHVSDSQCGYTAISLTALNSIDIGKIYKGYGLLNDILVKLNIVCCKITEVPIKPIYDIGEKSKMKIMRVLLPISFLMLRSFFKRLYVKYLFRDFHPLFLLYNLSFLLGAISIPFFIDIFKIIIFNLPTKSTVLIPFMFLFISSFQSFLFAMWMDIQDNERLFK